MILPLLGQECERREFTWTDYEYVWCRADDTEVTVIQGRILDAVQIGDHYAYWVESVCLDEQPWHCADSTITLSLHEGTVYTIVAWTEPADRRFPEREVVELRKTWTCCDN